MACFSFPCVKVNLRLTGSGDVGGGGVGGDTMKVKTTFEKMALVNWPPPALATSTAAVVAEAAATKGLVTEDPLAAKVLADNVKAYKVLEKDALVADYETSDGGSNVEDSEEEEGEQQQREVDGVEDMELGNDSGVDEGGRGQGRDNDNDDDDDEDSETLTLANDRGSERESDWDSEEEEDDGEKGARQPQQQQQPPPQQEEEEYDDDDDDDDGDDKEKENEDDEGEDEEMINMGNVDNGAVAAADQLVGGSGGSRSEQKELADCIKDCEKRVGGGGGGSRGVKDSRPEGGRLTTSRNPSPSSSDTDVDDQMDARRLLLDRHSSKSKMGHSRRRRVNSKPYPKPNLRDMAELVQRRQSTTASAEQTAARAGAATPATTTRQDTVATVNEPTAAAAAEVVRGVATTPATATPAPAAPQLPSRQQEDSSDDDNHPPPLVKSPLPQPQQRGRKRLAVGGDELEGYKQRVDEEVEDGDGDAVMVENGAPRRLIATRLYRSTICDTCGDSFKDAVKYSEHACLRKRKTNKDKDLTCPDCGKSFTSEKRFDTHRANSQACENIQKKNRNQAKKAAMRK